MEITMTGSLKRLLNDNYKCICLNDAGKSESITDDLVANYLESAFPIKLLFER